MDFRHKLPEPKYLLSFTQESTTQRNVFFGFLVSEFFYFWNRFYLQLVGFQNNTSPIHIWKCSIISIFFSLAVKTGQYWMRIFPTVKCINAIYPYPQSHISYKQAAKEERRLHLKGAELAFRSNIAFNLK